MAPRHGLTVKVANGERVTSGGVCLRMPLQIGDEHFITNMYALPLDGFDIVLGSSGSVPWVLSYGTSTT